MNDSSTTQPSITRTAQWTLGICFSIPAGALLIFLGFISSMILFAVIVYGLYLPFMDPLNLHKENRILPGYYLDQKPLELIYSSPFGVPNQIQGVIPPAIYDIWWNDKFIITSGSDAYYAIEPELESIWKFQKNGVRDRDGLEEWTQCVGLDLDKVEYEFIPFHKTYRLLEEKQREAIIPFDKDNPENLLLYYSKLGYKNSFQFLMTKGDESAKTPFLPEIEMVDIPSGILRLPVSKKEIPISPSFSIGKYEITQSQFQAVMGWLPTSEHGYGENYPVYNVSWDEAMRFCSNLTDMARAQGKIGENQSYTLPTNYQWEYACRAGTGTLLYNGKDLNSEDYSSEALEELAWYWYNKETSYHGTHEVGQKQANPWGIYDLYGNVGEWCSGISQPQPLNIEISFSDFEGYLQAGYLHPVAGGSWYDRAWRCVSAHSNSKLLENDTRSPSIGFRIILIQNDPKIIKNNS